MFHVSPRRNRDDILARGLKLPDAGSRYVWMVDDKATADEAAKLRWAGSRENDVWAIDATHLDLTPDPHPGTPLVAGHSYVSTEPIDPGRVYLANDEFARLTTDTARDTMFGFDWTSPRDGSKWTARVGDEASVDLDTRTSEVTVDITRNGRPVGIARRSLFEDRDGTLTLFHDNLEIDAEHQGEGFGDAYVAATLDKARAAGVARALVTAAYPGGGYAWARTGFLPYDTSHGHAHETWINRPQVEHDAPRVLLRTYHHAIGVLRDGDVPEHPAGLDAELDLLGDALRRGEISTPAELAAWHHDGPLFAWPYDYEAGWDHVKRHRPMSAAKILLRASEWDGVMYLQPA